ncbi:MAG: hypothetical protein V4577_28070 [Bacteroidota bacterium]
MTRNYISLTILVLLCLSSCKKEAKTPKTAIIGKWYENKLVLHTSGNTGVDHDTTFTAGAFTKNDYYQFTGNQKAVFSQSGVYGYTGKSLIWGAAGMITGVSHYTWSIADSTLTLNYTDANPATEYSGTTYSGQTIIQLDAHHLVLRTQYFSPGPFNLTTTSYFTKGN